MATTTNFTIVKDFRLDNVKAMQDILIREGNNRMRSARKYKRAVNIANAIETSLCSVSIITGTATAATLSAVVTIPMAGVLSCVTVLSGSLSMIIRVAGIKLNKKCRKHDRIAILAKAKKNSVDLLISSSLVDDVISNSEFESIIQEMGRYEDLKNEIRMRNSAKMPKIFDTDWDKYRGKIGNKVYN